MVLFSVAPCSQSDKEFLIELYQDYKRLMFSVAKRYIFDFEVCEDIVQDSLEKLIKKIVLLRTMERSVLAGYIVSTVRNTAINYLKKQGRIQEYQNSLEAQKESEVSSSNLPLDELLILYECKSSLQKVWAFLSIEDRMILEGKYILGYTDSELALQLGCKSDSIRMKLTRARRRALKLMMEQGGALCDET